MKKRGRPVGSSIRQNLVEILYHKGKAYGYGLYRDYCAIFPKVTLRVIYYHLRKGVALGEFVLETIKLEKGNYSWGDAAEKKYYKLGPGVKPMIDPRVSDYFSKKEARKKAKRK